MRPALASRIAAAAVTFTIGVIVAVATPAHAALGDDIAGKAASYLGKHYNELGLPAEEWCADFVHKVWTESFADDNWGQRTNAGAASYNVYGKYFGTQSSTPRKGDAVTFDWKDELGRQDGVVDHVAIVVSVNSSARTFDYIGGNQGDWSHFKDRIVSRKNNVSWVNQEVVKFNGPKSAAVLKGNGVLLNGAQISAANNRATLRQQGDGNLVVKDENGAARWGAGTNPSGVKVAMQVDGNLVVYNGSGRALWSSRTNGHLGATLWIQLDGNVVIYEKSSPTLPRRILWATGTRH